MANKLVLAELKYFVTGVANICRGQLQLNNNSKIVRCSLYLLEDLPTSREVVLEYFAMVFDISVKNYVLFIENDSQGTSPDDEAVNDIQEALENLVTEGPPAWASLISSWSLRLLGSISHKNSRRRTMDIGSTCTFWLGSSAMRGLLGLSASCFGKLNSSETEDCIATLLSTFMQNSPHFDWVVARLGGCFPLKVISKILQCGLKGFLGNFNSTLDSEVGILAYLSFAHENDLTFALNEMLQAVLGPTQQGVQPNVNTIPYFLHLCAMSEILLQPIVNVFLEMFNESLIPNLVQQSQLWPKNFDVHEIIPQLSTLVIKLKNDAIKTAMTLAKIAEQYVWCQEFLEQILQELEFIVCDNRSCSFLTNLTKNESKQIVWQSLLSDCLFEQQTAIRLILLVSSQNPHIYHQTIAELLSKSYEIDNYGFGSLIRLINGVQHHQDVLQPKIGIEMALEWITIRESRIINDDIKKDYNIFKNLITLIHLEKQQTIKHLKRSLVTTTTSQCMSKILNIFANYLKRVLIYNDNGKQNNNIKNDNDAAAAADDDDDNDDNNIAIKKLKIDYNTCDLPMKKLHLYYLSEQVHIIADLLNILEIGGNKHLYMADIIKLAQSTVKYFFWTLYEKDTIKRTIYINRTYALLTRQCTARKSSCAVALRELLEGALYIYGHLFTLPSDNPTIQNENNNNNNNMYGTDNLLMTLNQKQSIQPTAIRSGLHAGLIGHGLKPPAPKANEPDPQIKNMFINAITACCKCEEIPTTIEKFSSVSLLLVEMVSSDVMYNGLPWPDEEFIKVTMERDLQICRTFKNAPILWSILGLVAAYRPSLCFTSVLLRGLCASVLHQWRAKTVDKYQTIANNFELFTVTKRILQILAMGQLLPSPLSHVHTVIEYLDPSEIAVVLKECVWNYMKENVPTPVEFFVDNTGLGWRHPIDPRPHPKFVDPLRNIMQRKLPQVGTLYYHMFVLPELCENLQNTNIDGSAAGNSK